MQPHALRSSVSCMVTQWKVMGHIHIHDIEMSSVSLN